MTGPALPRVAVGDVELAYLARGAGPETVVFSHSFLVDHRHFAAQIEALAATHRVIAYDHRDHGASGRATAPYSLDDLVDDGERLLDALDVGPCHWVGLSTGGFVGMRLALRARERLRSLVLMDTSAGREPLLSRLKSRVLLASVVALGVGPALGFAMRKMFGPAFLADPARADDAALWRARIAANDPRALRRFGRAILARDDVLDDLRRLDLPTLVVAGARDRALPVSCAEALADAIPRAEFALVPHAGHLCTVEQPDAVNDVLVPFVRAHGTR